MMLLAISAAALGFVHSLAPGHWLPVVLIAKTRRWSLSTSALGALVAASGHIILSIVLGAIAIQVGAELFSEYEAEIEKYAGLGLGVFGLIYAALAYFRHSGCHGHTHHGPEPTSSESSLKSALFFLLAAGLSPCVAVLPVFAAAAPLGSAAVVLTFVFFAAGVAAALVGSTLLVSLGALKLDHPIFEHYGDVLTGFGVAVLGIILFLWPHHHV